MKTRNGLPLVSIVMPVFEQREFIQHAIESVLGQAYRNIELVVLDGGSKDGTVEILEQYSGRIIWESQHDAGQAQAVNRGWQKSSGEIFGWLNGDDILEPDAVSYAVDRFLKDLEVDMVYGEAVYIDEFGDLLGKYPTLAFDYQKLFRGVVNFIPQPAVFFRRKVFDQFGGLDESLDFVMDYEYWLRVGNEIQVLALPNMMARLRIHSKAKSVAKLAVFGDELCRMYMQKFSEGHVLQNLITDEQAIMQTVMYKAADSAYWGRAWGQAWRWAVLAWGKNFRNFSWLLVLPVFGRWGQKTLESKIGHPYFINSHGD